MKTCDGCIHESGLWGSCNDPHNEYCLTCSRRYQDLKDNYRVTSSETNERKLYEQLKMKFEGR